MKASAPVLTPHANLRCTVEILYIVRSEVLLMAHAERMETLFGPFIFGGGPFFFGWAGVTRIVVAGFACCPGISEGLHICFAFSLFL